MVKVVCPGCRTSLVWKGAKPAVQLKCPRCGNKFRPKPVSDSPSLSSPAVPSKKNIACPGCRVSLKVSAGVTSGKKVKCPKCKLGFTVGKPPPPPVENKTRVVLPPSKPVLANGKPPTKAAVPPKPSAPPPSPSQTPQALAVPPSPAKTAPSKAKPENTQPRKLNRVYLLGIVVTLAFLVFLFYPGTSGPKVVKIEGTLTRNGQPVPNMIVNFLPAKGRPSFGLTNEQGKFTLKYDQNQEGALIGIHKVSVAHKRSNPGEEADLATGRLRLHPEQEIILAKYGPQNSPLSVEVKQEGQTINLELP